MNCAHVRTFEPVPRHPRFRRCALVNSLGEQPLEHYNAAPTTLLAVLRLQHANLLAEGVPRGWRPHWAQDRPPPINARVEKVAHGAFFHAI